METPHYVAARVQRVLAEDDRTSELGIRVDVRGEHVYLRGQVPSEERRRTIETVAREATPGLRVHNEITLVEVREPGEEEHL
ncbi:BON domain-containing protein [Sphaerimonospora mesophila]|uniref:BON domain-containing protein n=1 Tax=Sphaerimonospora mesophila TaxID=37483 RepID=UPI0006E2A79F